MRAFLLLVFLLLSQLTFAAADYAREQKWADEIAPGIVVGDPVYLELKQGHKFLTIYTEVNQAKMGLIVVHGIGVHPDWNLVGTLRTQLIDKGYATLSVQMPVLANNAESEAYQPLFAEAEERIAVAVDFMHAKGYQKVAIVSHSLGSAMSRMYVVNNPFKLVAWASLGMGHGYSYSGIKVPVFDLYAENDLPPVLKMAKNRAASLKGKAGSRQVRVAKTDHFFNGHEDKMVQEVSGFLDSIK